MHCNIHYAIRQDICDHVDMCTSGSLSTYLFKLWEKKRTSVSIHFDFIGFVIAPYAVIGYDFEFQCQSSREK